MYLLTCSLTEKNVKVWDFQERKKVAAFTFDSGVSAIAFNAVTLHSLSPFTIPLFLFCFVIEIFVHLDQ